MQGENPQMGAFPMGNRQRPTLITDTKRHKIILNVQTTERSKILKNKWGGNFTDIIMRTKIKAKHFMYCVLLLLQISLLQLLIIKLPCK